MSATVGAGAGGAAGSVTCSVFRGLSRNSHPETTSISRAIDAIHRACMLAVHASWKPRSFVALRRGVPMNVRRLTPTILLTGFLTTCLWSKRMETVGEIVVNGEQIDLRKRGAGMRPNAPETPPLLVIALDGVSRALLYDTGRHKKLPNLASLLGGHRLEHAYFDDTLLSTLPSSTMAAWVT